MTIDSPVPARQVPLDQSGPSAGLRHAAEQFEAMFVGQMLRSVRESASDDDSDDDDGGANSAFLELAEDQFGQALAARGGLGIATMVTTELGKTNQ
jgi:flagellar protein FlgJ